MRQRPVRHRLRQNLANQELNLRRYQTLADEDAIAMQTVTDQEAATAQQNAVLRGSRSTGSGGTGLIWTILLCMLLSAGR